MKVEKRWLLLGIVMGISSVFLLVHQLTRTGFAQPTPEGKKHPRGDCGRS